MTLYQTTAKALKRAAVVFRALDAGSRVGEAVSAKG